MPIDNPIVLILFANWLQAKASNQAGNLKMDDFQDALKKMGYHAGEDGDGFPRLGHWYPGDIELGQRYIWEPTRPHATELVEVVGIRTPIDDERRIETITVRDRHVVWNEEYRFREACIPYVESSGGI